MAMLMAGLACVAIPAVPVCAQAPASPQAAMESKPDSAAERATPQVSADLPLISPLNALAGRRVHEIKFRGAPSVLDPQRLLALIPQKVNEPLDKRKLRDSMQALYATGRFQDIEVATEPAPQGEISVVFIAKQNQFVGPMGLIGAPRGGPTDHQLLNATKLQLGELLTDERLKEAISGIRRVLEDNGYYRATITPQLTPHGNTQEVAVAFQVEADRQAHIGDVRITGNPGYTEEQVEEIAKLHGGDPATLQGVTRALQRLRKKYQKQNRLEAQVALVSRVYRPESNAVDYTMDIQRGPLVAIHVEGARLSPGIVKKNVPVYEENAVDDDLLNEGRRNLRDYMQTQGYFEAQVSVVRKQEAGSDQTDIIYDIDKRARHKVVAIAIDGNKYFSDELVRDRMQIQPAGWLLTQGLFSQSMLNRDVEAIQDLYHANGFQQVQVQPEIVDDYERKKGQMRVVLHINEGLQTRVQDLSILGNTTFASDELGTLLANVPGQPFSESNMAADHDALVNFYFNRGFPDVAVNYSAKAVAGEPARMDVTYTITEGARVYVNQVLVSGLHFTRPYVVKQQIVPRSGDPLSQADLLTTQSRLYDLGIFNAVDVAVQNPDGKEPYKDVLLNLTEARRYTFDYGLGFEVQTGSAPSGTTPQGRTGASPRVSFDVNRLNFRGRDDTIFFKSHFGRLQQRALLGYEVPHWLNRDDLKLTFNTFYDNTRDVLTFTSQRVEGSVQVEQRWSKATTLLYRMAYRNVRVDASTLAIDPNLIPLYSRPVRVGMPSFTFIRDTRDDPVDSRKGNYFVFDTGVAAHQFGSQTNFARFLVQHSEYHAFGYKGRYVLAHSTQLGIEQPWGTNAIIPLPERFFAGGGNALRAFALNEAGPRDQETGYQLGGEAMFINSVELRFPPIPLPFLGKDLSPVMFHDMGNVFASTGDVFPSLFRWSQPDKENCRNLLPNVTCSFNYMAHAVGMGIRYRTPIGPVRFDLGYNLNPPTFPIREQSRFETLHPVNFFFSIGQTF